MSNTPLQNEVAANGSDMGKPSIMDVFSKRPVLAIVLSLAIVIGSACGNGIAGFAVS